MTACQGNRPKPDSPTLVHHLVICWLKKPGDPDAWQKLMQLTGILSEIPGVLTVRSGHMIPSPRAIVDSTFDVAFIISFSNQAQMKAYLTHPTHKKVIEETIRPLVERLVVYDIQE